MDVWYDLLVRELTHLDRAQELREDAEQSVNPQDVESTPPPCPTAPAPASAGRPLPDPSWSVW